MGPDITLAEASDEDLWEEIRARGLGVEEFEAYMAGMEGEEGESAPPPPEEEELELA